MKNKPIKAILILATMSTSGFVTNTYASDKSPQISQKLQQQNPVNFLNDTILKLQTKIENNIEKIQENPIVLKEMVEKDLIPYFDENIIARSMLGKKWKNSTSIQKTEFTNDFINMLVNIYSSAVAKVGEYTVTILPYRGNSWQRKKYIKVYGNIKLQGSEDKGSSLNVYLVKYNDSWKIIDIAVSGVSFVENYRSQFKALDTMVQAIAGVKKINDRTRS